MRVATGYWAPTESSQPEPCPEAGFYCPGYEHDDTNEPPGSKPILIDAGLYRAASSVSSTVSRLHFALTTLATQLTLEEVQSRLADLYQVATTSVEVHDDDGTTTDDEGTTDDDGRRQLMSGRRVLQQPPLPERPTKAAAAAAAAATRSGLKYLGAASPRRMLLEGGRALGIDLKAASERPSDQALLLAAYAAVGEADLSAALGGATVVSEAASLVSSAAVDVVMGSVACPRGHWCSAGNAIPCGANTYEEGDQVRAAEPQPPHSTPLFLAAPPPQHAAALPTALHALASKGLSGHTVPLTPLPLSPRGCTVSLSSADRPLVVQPVPRQRRVARRLERRPRLRVQGGLLPGGRLHRRRRRVRRLPHRHHLRRHQRHHADAATERRPVPHLDRLRRHPPLPGLLGKLELRRRRRRGRVPRVDGRPVLPAGAHMPLPSSIPRLHPSRAAHSSTV